MGSKKEQRKRDVEKISLKRKRKRKRKRKTRKSKRKHEKKNQERQGYIPKSRFYYEIIHY